MGVLAGSPARTRAIVTGVVGVMLELLFGISITSFAVNAGARDATTGPVEVRASWRRGCSRLRSSATPRPPPVAARIVQPWLFEAPLEDDASATTGRGAGLVAPWLFEAPLEDDASATTGRGAGLVQPWLFEAPIEGE